jgi:hypothetical protein
MDFDKLESIANELFSKKFCKLDSDSGILTMLVFKDLYTIDEAKELITYTVKQSDINFI